MGRESMQPERDGNWQINRLIQQLLLELALEFGMERPSRADNSFLVF